MIPLDNIPRHPIERWAYECDGYVDAINMIITLFEMSVRMVLTNFATQHVL